MSFGFDQWTVVDFTAGCHDQTVCSKDELRGSPGFRVVNETLDAGTETIPRR